MRMIRMAFVAKNAAPHDHKQAQGIINPYAPWVLFESVDVAAMRHQCKKLIIHLVQMIAAIFFIN